MTVRNRQLNAHMRVAGMNPVQAERFERNRLLVLSEIEKSRDRVRSVNWLK
jgi:hypothetical protein